MSGPAPKHVSVRARVNKASTRATLTERDPSDVKVPPLPPCTKELEDGQVIEVPWHPLTRAWWAAIWPSPMAAEWHESDIFGLYAVAFLYDKFYRNPSAAAHAELRLARAPYGLTPIDRRKLEWSIGSVDRVQRENTAAEAKARVPAPQAPPNDGDDIRLRVV